MCYTLMQDTLARDMSLYMKEKNFYNRQKFEADAVTNRRANNAGRFFWAVQCFIHILYHTDAPTRPPNGFWTLPSSS